MPGTTIARRQPRVCSTPSISRPAITSGISIWVVPPPRLPQPAVVALAVPTTLGPNITEVWYWVMTKEAPMAPMARRARKKDSKLSAKPMHITGSEPRHSSQV